VVVGGRVVVTARPGDREWATALLGRVRAEAERVRATCRRHPGPWRVDRDGDGPAFVVDASRPSQDAGVVLALDRAAADHVARWSPRVVLDLVRGHVFTVSQYVDALDRLARLVSGPDAGSRYVEEARAEVGALRWGAVSMIAWLYPEEVAGGDAGDRPGGGPAEREGVAGAGGAGVGGDVGGGVRT